MLTTKIKSNWNIKKAKARFVVYYHCLYCAVRITFVFVHALQRYPYFFTPTSLTHRQTHADTIALSSRFMCNYFWFWFSVLSIHFWSTHEKSQQQQQPHDQSTTPDELAAKQTTETNWKNAKTTTKPFPQRKLQKWPKCTERVRVSKTKTTTTTINQNRKHHIALITLFQVVIYYLLNNKTAIVVDRRERLM